MGVTAAVASGIEAAERAPEPHERRTFALLWTGQFVAIAGLTVIVPLLPFYFAGLGMNLAEVAMWTGLALTAPAITQAVTGPLWGWVGDRYGRKAMVVRAQLGLALAIGLMALAANPLQFLAFRLIQGLFGGVVSANAVFASSLSAPHKQGRALGSLTAATGAGSLVGPLLGSLVASQLGFSALFTVVAALMVVVSLCSMVLLREPTAARETLDARPMPMTAAVKMLASTASNRFLIMAGFLAQAAIYALMVVFAPRVEQITASPAEATLWVGASQAVFWAAALVGAPWWGRRNDRLPPHRNFMLAAIGCALVVAMLGVPTDPELLLPLRLIQGFCFAALAQTVFYLVARQAPERGKGSFLGLTATAVDTGQIVGPLLGWLLAVTLPSTTAFLAIGLVFAASAALAVHGGRRVHPDPAAQTTPNTSMTAPSRQAGDHT